MSLKMTKAPFAIAAFAAAITLSTTSLATADAQVIQAPFVASGSAEVTEVGFKIKKHGVRHHGSFKHRSFKRHHSFHHRAFKHHRGFKHHRAFKHHGFVHHPKSRSRIIIKKRF